MWWGLSQFLLSSAIGKGADTIDNINKFNPIIVDPALQKDKSFWDYAVLARDNGGNVLRVLGEDGSSCLDVLQECGGSQEDIKYYLEHLDVFSPSCTSTANVSSSTFPSAALVALTSTLKAMSIDEVSGFDAVVEVRERTSLGEEEWGKASINVETLGELRALSICSYALLTKKS